MKIERKKIRLNYRFGKREKGQFGEIPRHGHVSDGDLLESLTDSGLHRQPKQRFCIQ